MTTNDQIYLLFIMHERNRYCICKFIRIHNVFLEFFAWRLFLNETHTQIEFFKLGRGERVGLFLSLVVSRLQIGLG